MRQWAMTAKRPSSEAKRLGTANNGAPPPVTGRYTALAARWLHSSTGAALVQAPNKAIPKAKKKSDPPKAKAVGPAQGSGLAKKLAAKRKGSKAAAAPAVDTKNAAGQLLTQGAQPNPYAMSREQVLEVLRKTNVLTPGGRLTKVFK
jgi:hypothetical protein